MLDAALDALLKQMTATPSPRLWEAGTEQARAMAMQVFTEEDEPMIAAAHEALGDTDFWDARPAILKTDAGAIRCRRVLMQLRRKEAGEAEAA